ncbi:MAG: DUF2238 domain-containing protein [Actinomycetota bacterium]|jgi:uncharacterized membrane protein YjdF|nr:DUF2238 domain-containing protein [Actinomycetota bacterium]
MKLLITERRPLAVFFVVYYAILLIYGAATGAPQTIFYAVFVGGAALLVARLYGRASFSPIVLWGLALWGLAHMVGGLVQTRGTVVYELGGGEFRFDKIVHFFGFGFATLAAYEVVRHTVGRDAPASSVAITAAFVGLGIGAVNETIEFLITLLPADSNVGGFSNTGWDLVANALGAATAAWLAPKLEGSSNTGVAPSRTARG